MAALLGAMAYQLAKVIPYTKLHKRLDTPNDSDGMVSILAVNVPQTNSQFDKLIHIIKELDSENDKIKEGKEKAANDDS